MRVREGLDFHSPPVKSGNSTGLLPCDTDSSEIGEITLEVTESYTSQSGIVSFLKACTMRCQVMWVRPPEPCPRMAGLGGGL